MGNESRKKKRQQEIDELWLLFMFAGLFMVLLVAMAVAAQIQSAALTNDTRGSQAKDVPMSEFVLYPTAPGVQPIGAVIPGTQIQVIPQ